MKMKPFTLTGAEGTQIQAYSWEPGLLKKSRGVFIILHGMAEHAQRYDSFAGFLAGKGLSVYSMDLRGHGKTAGSIENLGFIAERGGWNLVLEDISLLIQKAKEEHPKLPVILFGHSMGTILARGYHAAKGGALAGMILSGLVPPMGMLGPVGASLASLEIIQRGKRAKSVLLHKMNFGAHNKPFKPARTDFDWLSRDTAEVDKYIEDPYCGTVFTTSFYRDLLSGIADLEKPSLLNHLPADTPLYFFCGDADPVGKFGKGILLMEKLYRKYGVKDITVKIYKEGRHESLNEVNKTEVYQDIYDWLSIHLPR